MGRNVLLALAISCTYVVSDASAQGVQAIRNSAPVARIAAPNAISHDSALVLLGMLTTAVAATESAEPVRSDADLRSAAAEIRERAAEAIAFSEDPEAFAAAFREVGRSLVRFQAVWDAKKAAAAASAAAAPDSTRVSAYSRAQAFTGGGIATDALVKTMSGGVGEPGFSTLVPAVVFTIGPTFDAPLKSNSAFAGKQGWVTAIDVSTNLLGAAAGSAFSGLGADKFGEYLTNNISVGTAIPASGATRISADLSLGLGGVTLGNWLTLWPVIQIQQLDSADARIPVRSALGGIDSKQWSVPSFSVGFIFGTESWLKKRLEAGKLVAVPIVGLQLPYYYPGDSFTALAALFSSRRSSYVRTGPSRVNFGLSIPLLKVGASSSGGAQSH